ncbi:MAG: carotenoid biosynthesis protein, partial [Bacteroidota bacterium]
MERTKRTITAVTVFLAIFHQVGVLGLHLESTQPLFEKLIPLNLLLSLGVLALFHKAWTTQFSIYTFVIFWAGYLVEVLGVATEAIFGTYTYGESLGFKIAGVPPMM